MFYVLSISLAALCGLLAVLSVRGLLRFGSTRSRAQLMWGGGLALAAAAMGVETVVYLGMVSVPILQAYVFLSAAIVGILSLGATKILKSRGSNEGTPRTRSPLPRSSASRAS